MLKKEGKFEVKVLLLLPFFTPLLYFLLVVFILPFYVFRSAVYLYEKCTDITTSKVITGLSASLLRDYDVHQEKPLSTIVVCLKGKGRLSLHGFRELFRSRVVLKRDPKNKTFLQFPELQQYYTMCWGYVLLKWDRNFDLRNHVKLYEGGNGPVTRKDLMEIWEGLMTKPFPKGRSPWEVILVENVNLDGGEDDGLWDKDTIIFLRIHHGIADGFAIQKMLLSLDTDNSTDLIGSEPAINFSKLQRFFWNCRIALFGPFDLLKQILNGEHFHTFHLPREKLSKEYFVVESETMNLAEIKRIKNYFGVSFTTILISVVGGGVRRFLEKSGRPFPTFQGLGVPFAAKLGAGDNLGNDFMIAPLSIPVNLQNADERVKNVQAQFEVLRHSTISQMLGLTIDCLSCLPINLMRILTKKSLFSTAYSTLPGPLKPITIPGSKLTEVSFTYGTGAASLGLCFSSITYVDLLRMTIFVDKNLLQSRKLAQEMIQCLTEEFKHLSELSFRGQ